MNRIIFLTISLLLLFIHCEKDLTPVKPHAPEEKLVLTGQVVEKQSGNPVAGAVVKALKNQVSDTTNSSGSFRLEELSPGRDTIFVAVPGYLILKEAVQIQQGIQSLILSLTSVLTRVTLQNQTEHSGIMVKIVELDTFTITDPAGHFLFGKLPNGSYTLEAKYPYFSTEQLNIAVSDSLIQTEVQIQLRQQLQFWIEPPETTFSRSNLGDPYYFCFSGLKLYAVNITNEPVTVGTYFEPIKLWALVPQGFDWPYVPNPDNRPEFCYDHYGWFGAEDAIISFNFSFQPGDTLVTLVPEPLNTVLKDCVIPGDYLFFAAINDLGHYPEYFYGAYFWTDSLPHPQPLNPLNKTLLLKRELFNPVIVFITN